MPGLPTLLKGLYIVFHRAVARAHRYLRSMGSGYMMCSVGIMGTLLRVRRHMEGYVSEDVVRKLDDLLLQLKHECPDFCIDSDKGNVPGSELRPGEIGYRIFFEALDYTTITAISKSRKDAPLHHGDIIQEGEEIVATIKADPGCGIGAYWVWEDGRNMHYQAEEFRTPDGSRIIRMVVSFKVSAGDVKVGSSGTPPTIMLKKMRSKMLRETTRVHDACIGQHRGPFRVPVQLDNSHRINAETHPDTWEEWMLHAQRNSRFYLRVTVTCDCDKPFESLRSIPGFPSDYFDDVDVNALKRTILLPDGAVQADESGVFVYFSREMDLLESYDSKWHHEITNVVCSHANDGRLIIKTYLIAEPR